MKQNSMYKKGVVITIIALFVGMSILPATGSILLEESLKPTFYENESKTPQSPIDTQMKYHKRLSQSHFLDYESMLYSKDRESQLQREQNRYEVTETPSEEVWTDISNRGSYTPHDPIDIHGNGEFTAENGVTGGNGTSDDPYIIEGWEIITPKPQAIAIYRTTAYFIVRNCYLQSDVFVFDFYELEHGKADNIVILNGIIGFEVWDSSDVTITNSSVSSVICVRVQKSNYVSVSHCSLNDVSVSHRDLSSSDTGVFLFMSAYVDLINLSIQQVRYGIYSVDCHYNTITECDIFSNNYGMSIIASGFWVLRNNTMNDNKIGLSIASLISLDGYIHDIDTSNTIDGKPVYYLRNASDLVFDGSEGIGFLGFVECDNITVKNFDMSNSGNSLIFAGSRDCIVTQSTFIDNIGGIDCVWSSNTRITDCVCIGIQAYGIFIVDSPHTIMRNNTISEGGTFGVFGEKLEDFLQDIDTSNTIDGKPIYYLVGEENKRITKTTEMGYLALVNCKNMKVINVELNYNEQGLLLVNTTGVVRGCKFSFNYVGIQIFGDSKLTIFGCTVNFNIDGFQFFQASDVRVIRCRVLSSSYGFYFYNSHDNLIVGCNIAFNDLYGIISEYSWSNVICFNTFLNNGFGGISMRDDCRENEICFNSIVNCYVGVSMWYFSWGNEVHHNAIKRCTLTGVDVDESSDNNSIHHNNVENNFIGIWVARSDGTQVDHNNIVGNDEGMVVYYCIVDAKENWWGSADGPSGIGPGSGDIIRVGDDTTVYYEPWLERPVRVKIDGILYIIKSIFGLT